ncbi:MAG: DUF1858 domain-containing protein [Acidobacteriota bacterium]
MIVNPESKIGPLLDAHPELEEVLIRLSPEFRRLQNPILRHTVARVATVAQAARIGGLGVPDMVNSLRRALGQPAAGCDHGEAAGETGPAPTWVAAEAAVTIDAEAILARGGTPVGEALAALAGCESGQVLLLDAPFYPAPLVDTIRQKGHEVHAEASGAGAWRVWVKK